MHVYLCPVTSVRYISAGLKGEAVAWSIAALLDAKIGLFVKARSQECQRISRNHFSVSIRSSGD